MSEHLEPGKRQSLQEAAQWHAELGQSSRSETMVTAWRDWLETDPQHQWAWQQVEHLTKQLTELPGNLSFQAMERSEQSVSRQRRAVLRSLTGLAVLGLTGWGALNIIPTKRWLADYQTATGETETFQLTDGSMLTLNTTSAVDIHFTSKQRLLTLKQGEIMVETAKRSDSRPFYVQTRDGLLQALGTRFSVFQDEDVTVLSVFEHRVALIKDNQTIAVCEAGQQMCIQQQKLISSQALTGTESSWAQHLLVADDMPVDRFVASLSRYRLGVLSCDPALNEFRISGTFDLRDTDQALRAISHAFPAKIHYFSPYWVRVNKI